MRILDTIAMTISVIITGVVIGLAIVVFIRYTNLSGLDLVAFKANCAIHGDVAAAIQWVADEIASILIMIFG